VRKLRLFRVRGAFFLAPAFDPEIAAEISAGISAGIAQMVVGPEHQAESLLQSTGQPVATAPVNQHDIQRQPVEVAEARSVEPA